MNIRSDMQEITLKYENQKTVAESLENIKTSLEKSFKDLTRDFSKLEGQCEALKHDVLTKEKLIDQQEQANRQFVETLRQQRQELELDYQR